MATKKTATKGKSATATKAKKAPAKKAVVATKAAPVKKASAKKPEVQAAPAAANGEAKIKKLSAIDAAAHVLAESREALNTKQMIEAMATGGLWTSPGGKTPSATLYSSIIREIAMKGNASRFFKADRGQFVVNAQASGK